MNQTCPPTQRRLGHLHLCLVLRLRLHGRPRHVFYLPLDLWIKGYLTMGILMLIQSCVTMTKTIRDMHESGKLVNRIEDAKAERLLMEVSKAA